MNNFLIIAILSIFLSGCMAYTSVKPDGSRTTFTTSPSLIPGNQPTQE